MRRVSFLLTSAVLAAAVLAPTAPASEGGRDQEVHGYFFDLPASNGYTFSFSISRGSASALLIRGDKDGTQAASYVRKGRPPVLTQNRFRVSFGRFGEVRGRYRDKPGVQPCKESTGAFRGSIRFRGEDGYAEVSARRAAASTNPFTCTGPFRPSSLADLRAAADKLTMLTACKSEEHLRYTVFETDDQTLHVADSYERTKQLRILRQTELVGAKASFTHSIDQGTATVSPGGLFNGSATLASGRLTGDLTVPFAGLGERALTPAAARFGQDIADLPRDCLRLGT